MEKWEPQAYALLRIVAGALFLCHGLTKLFGYPSPAPAEAPAFVIYGAGSIELIGGLLIAIGLQARWAAFISSGTMAFAYFMAHAPKGFYPAVNGGELAVLYCFVFLFIAARGSGIWSVDAARSAS